MARLVIFDDNVRAVELPDRQIMIGRSRKNDIPINDGLLSRKHCSIVPVDGGYRLLDLKSSNGTYLNGERIDKMDLTVDDIVEIGRTVIVFLGDGVWNRGEALARLRNPIKAQELIGRIKHQKIPAISVGPKPAPTSAARSRKVRRSRRVAGPSALPSYPDLLDALEAFTVDRAVLLLLKDSPSLRRVVTGVLSEVLGEGGAAGGSDAAGLRARIRKGLEARLADASPPEAARDKDGGHGAGAGEP